MNMELGFNTDRVNLTAYPNQYTPAGRQEFKANGQALQKRFISAKFSLSVGSIINVPATGQDIVGA